jgi:hypothetical protein
MKMPEARGPVTQAVIAALVSPPDSADVGPAALKVGTALQCCDDITRDEDLQLALLLLYELHYRGLAGVDDRWEWHPGLLGLRAQIEGLFESTLRARVHVPSGVGPLADEP